MLKGSALRQQRTATPRSGVSTGRRATRPPARTRMPHTCGLLGRATKCLDDNRTCSLQIGSTAVLSGMAAVPLRSNASFRSLCQCRRTVKTTVTRKLSPFFISGSLGGQDQTGKSTFGSPKSGVVQKKRDRWRTSASAVEYAESLKMYDVGLKHVRSKRYESGRRILQTCATRHPSFERAWVTLAQMEKKVTSREMCEQILKKGLLHNPRSAALLQAWGLHLLQEGDARHDLMAYGLLRASVTNDPENRGVMRWKRVREIGIQWKRARHQKRKRRHRLQKLAIKREEIENETGREV